MIQAEEKLSFWQITEHIFQKGTFLISCTVLKDMKVKSRQTADISIDLVGRLQGKPCVGAGEKFARNVVRNPPKKTVTKPAKIISAKLNI